MLLAILICHQPHRAAYLEHLLSRLDAQKNDDVTTIVDAGDAPTVGDKRNRLLLAAKDVNARYTAFVDDDDDVPPHYKAKLIAALRFNPDCVGFKVRRYVDGVLRGEARHTIKYTQFNDRISGMSCDFDRTPNHLNPVRLDLAMAAWFPSQDRGEDNEYARRLRPMLKSEVYLDEYLYDYFKRVRTCQSLTPPIYIAPQNC